MVFTVKSNSISYDIVIEKGGLGRVAEIINTNRKVLIVTDDMIPAEYAERVAALCRTPVIHRIKAGEASKCVEVWQSLLHVMLENKFSRSDCVIAVGGGVVGDLSGFAAACYMRGIDFYNIPTTVLSQVDSSIGGKTAIDMDGIKNIVGAFYPPHAVIVDTDLLRSLPARQISNGLAESVKMALCFDAELFERFERESPEEILETAIERSLLIKKAVVEADEKESGLRRVLNFGHTIGHGIEACSPSLYHGECVALGMIPMCSDEVRARLLPVLNKLKLPTTSDADRDAVYAALTHDKKTHDSDITIVTVEKVGSFEMKNVPVSSLKSLIARIPGGESNQ